MEDGVPARDREMEAALGAWEAPLQPGLEVCVNVQLAAMRFPIKSDYPAPRRNAHNVVP